MVEHLAINNDRPDLISGWVEKDNSKKRTWFRNPRVARKGDETVLFEERHLMPFIGTASGYILNRGISLDTAKAWELGIDRNNIRATFVVRKYSGQFAALVGRDINKIRTHIKYTNYLLDKKQDRLVPWRDYKRDDFSYDDYVSPTKSHFLYGEHFAVKYSHGHDVEAKKQNLIVVEGMMDVLRLWQLGYNVVGIMGSRASEHQVSKMKLFLPKGGKLVIMLDGDDAGRDGTDRLIDDLGGAVPVQHVCLPDGRDPGDLSNDEIEYFLNLGLDL